MAKPLVVSHLGATSSFQLSKLDRQKLYGSRRRIPVDADGLPCSRAALTDDGSVLVTAGMIAQGWFDTDGRQVESRDIGAISADGTPLAPVPSTLGEPQGLVGPMAPADLLDLAISSIYQLEPESLADGLQTSLQSGELWSCPFNYRSDFFAETGFLLANDHGYFLLVGVPTAPRFLEPNAPPPPEDDEEADDELDFEML